jgi:hypothetical protein
MDDIITVMPDEEGDHRPRYSLAGVAAIFLAGLAEIPLRG